MCAGRSGPPAPDVRRAHSAAAARSGGSPLRNSSRFPVRGCGNASSAAIQVPADMTSRPQTRSMTADFLMMSSLYCAVAAVACTIPGLLLSLSERPPRWPLRCDKKSVRSELRSADNALPTE